MKQEKLVKFSELYLQRKYTSLPCMEHSDRLYRVSRGKILTSENCLYMEYSYIWWLL